MVYKIDCVWQMCGTFDVEAESLEEAIGLVEDAKSPYDGLPKNSDYVDESFVVDEPATIDQNEV